jgi:hypothetical protein
VQYHLHASSIEQCKYKIIYFKAARDRYCILYKILKFLDVYSKIEKIWRIWKNETGAKPDKPNDGTCPLFCLASGGNRNYRVQKGKKTVTIFDKTGKYISALSNEIQDRRFRFFDAWLRMSLRLVYCSKNPFAQT